MIRWSTRAVGVVRRRTVDQIGGISKVRGALACIELPVEQGRRLVLVCSSDLLHRLSFHPFFDLSSGVPGVVGTGDLVIN